MPSRARSSRWHSRSPPRHPRACSELRPKRSRGRWRSRRSSTPGRSSLPLSFFGDDNAHPAAGKEGWFWYALAPLVVATIFPMTLLPLLASWLIGWDVILHEGALFHDFAGATSPSSPSWLFRWGPLHAPFTADLSQVAVGPFVSQMIALRAIHVVAVAILFYDA